MDPFCYRLEIRGSRFINIAGVEPSDCESAIKNDSRTVELNHWTVTINIPRLSDSFDPFIGISYQDPEQTAVSYAENYLLSDGFLFLLDCGQGQRSSFFQRSSPFATLRQRFGITAVYYDEPEGSYTIDWFNLRSNTTNHIQWAFSDGEIENNLAYSSPDDPDLCDTAEMFDMDFANSA